jgi:TP901 family phage tail tape measure protein
VAKDVTIWVRVKDGFSAGLARAKSGFSGFGKSFLKGAKSVAKGAAIIAAAVAIVVKKFIDFNKGMARVEALMGGKMAAGLRREVKQLASEFGIATDELVNGLYNALSAGVPKDNVIDFLRTSAKAAIADGSDISVAVDGITTVINAFKLSADDAGRVADVMFKTVALGKTNFAELSATIATVAPLAAASGVAFEEVFAAVATLTKAGNKTAVSMTMIRAALLSVNEQLGDGWSETMSLQEAFIKLTEMAGGTGTSLKDLMGRVEGYMAVIGLAGENSNGAAAALAEMTSAAGTLDEAMSGTSTQAKAWDRLVQTLKVGFIDIGGAIFGAGEGIDKFTFKLKSGIASLMGFIAGSKALMDSPVGKPGGFGIPVKGDFKRMFAAYKKAASEAETDALDSFGMVEKFVMRDGVEVPLKQIKAEAAARRKAERDRLSGLSDFEKADAAMQAGLEAEATATNERLSKEDLARKKVTDDAIAQMEKDHIAFLAKEEIAEAKRTAASKKLIAIKLQEDITAATAAANKALFIDVPQTFKQGFAAFVGRRDAAGLAQEDNTKLLKKVEDAKARQARGIKRQGDAKLLADVAAFKKAEAMRKKAEDDILQVQKDIRDNLKKNLEAAQKAV